jgi:hypothetical protein
MVHLRRTGLVVGSTALVVLLVGAYAAEGFGLALIVAIAALVVAAFVIPLISIFEEDRDLPFEQAARRKRR